MLSLILLIAAFIVALIAAYAPVVRNIHLGWVAFALFILSQLVSVA